MREYGKSVKILVLCSENGLQLSFKKQKIESEKTPAT